MASFADAFSQEGLGQLMADPRMVLGLQLMAQGRQGSGAQVLGQAGGQAAQLIAQQQHSQQLQAYRQQMAEAQRQQIAMQQQAAQAKQDALQRQQQAFSDPQLQAQLGPLARVLAAQGLDPETVLRANSNDALQAHRQAQLAQQQGQFEQRQAHIGSGGGGSSGPRMPTQRQVLDQPLGGGMMQRHVLNAQTGQYEKYGEPFSQYSPGRKPAKANKADPLESALDELAPLDGAAVPGLPGADAVPSYTRPPQGAELLMSAVGSNPHANVRAPARPTTQAEYDALPAGSQYIDPASGKVATKKAR
ncbi:hypothetical protein D3C77_113810 [compost metagenome]